MARTSLKVLRPPAESDHHYCERCGVKVSVAASQCPKCLGPLVRRNLYVVRAQEDLAAREREHRRALRAPVAIALGALGLAGVGLVFSGWAGSAKPLVADPVVLGRPTVSASTASHAGVAVVEDPFDVSALDSGEDADTAFRAGELDRALADYMAVLERRADDANALNNAGQVLVRMGRAPEAVPLLERAVANQPRSWMAQFNLARALGATGDWARAAEHYGAAAMLMPDSYPVLFNLGRALVKAGRDDAAAEAFARAAASKDAGPDAWLMLATTQERLGKAEEARSAFERYLELEPASPERARVEQHIAKLTSADRRPDPSGAQ